MIDSLPTQGDTCSFRTPSAFFMLLYEHVIFNLPFNWKSATKRAKCVAKGSRAHARERFLHIKFVLTVRVRESLARYDVSATNSYTSRQK